MTKTPEQLRARLVRARTEGCQACIYWHKLRMKVEVGCGQCRMQPPRLVEISGAAESWLVTYDDDWCGEWFPRELTVAASTETNDAQKFSSPSSAELDKWLDQLLDKKKKKKQQQEGIRGNPNNE